MGTAARSPGGQVAQDRARRGRRETRRAPPPDPGPPTAVGTAAGKGQPVDLDTLCARWRGAFDAANASLLAAAAELPATELGARTRSLTAERESTLRLLKAVAREQGVSGRFLHLTPKRDEIRLLGLPAGVTACVFNLDEVLIGSATLHAAAWMETFDQLIWARIERTRGEFAPFNPGTDYRRHIHGKPRLEGVRDFLASRGISLPEGSPEDAPGTETIHGLANRKNEALQRRIDQYGVTAYEGSVHYLQIAHEAGIKSAVVSASTNTATILDRSGLGKLIDGSVDGITMLAEHLRRKPAPDTLLEACRRLEVEPRHAASFETSEAGVAAARTGGFALVVGVDRAVRADLLRARGADLIIPGLAELLERRLAA